MKRKTFLVMIVALACACTRPDQQAAIDAGPVGDPVPGDWAIVQFDSDTEILNPMLSTTASAARIQYGMNGANIFETLLQYDPADWSFTKPLLAEAYPDVSSDHLVYTFTLRDGVQWHDGRPLSAEDVLFSMKVLMFPLVDTAEKRGYFAGLSDVQIPEPRKIRFTFARPNFLNVVFLGGYVAHPPEACVRRRGVARPSLVQGHDQQPRPE
jgi:peptide/nickel transport system substrate-binding protein